MSADDDGEETMNALFWKESLCITGSTDIESNFQIKLIIKLLFLIAVVYFVWTVRSGRFGLCSEEIAHFSRLLLPALSF